MGNLCIYYSNINNLTSILRYQILIEFMDAICGNHINLYRIINYSNISRMILFRLYFLTQCNIFLLQSKLPINPSSSSSNSSIES